MAKLCPQCEKENPSSANVCMFCGTRFVENAESDKMDALHNELSGAKETIQNLNEIIANLKKNNNNSEEIQQVVADYEAKLAKEKAALSRYKQAFSEKEHKLTETTKQPKKTKNNLTVWIVILLILSVCLGIWVYNLYKERDTKSSLIPESAVPEEVAAPAAEAATPVEYAAPTAEEEEPVEAAAAAIEYEEAAVKEHILSDLSTRLLTENDLRGLSKQELRILRNTIFARHGRKFKSPELREYFSAQSWYNPRYDEVTHLLNSIERKNIEFILSHE